MTKHGKPFTQEERAQFSAEINARKAMALSRVPLSSVVELAVKLVKTGNELKGLCPFHADRTIGSFSVNDKLAIYKCFSCGAGGNAIHFLMKIRGFTFLEALQHLEDAGGLSKLDFSNPALQKEVSEARAAREAEFERQTQQKRSRARSLWMGAEPIGGGGSITPALRYLEGRGIDFEKLGKVPGALRWRPDIGHREHKGQKNNRHPAMIAAIYGLNGQIIGCHRTYLDLSQWDFATKSGAVGKMRGVKDAKITLGPSLGGHIPIWKGEHRHPLRDIPEGTDIYVSEGIEDGLSVALASPSRRVIAGVSLSKLAGLDLPQQMGRLIFIGQNDDKQGAIEGFEAAVAAHQEAGREVALMMPPPDFKDFNDVLTGKRISRAEGEAR